MELALVEKAIQHGIHVKGVSGIAGIVHYSNPIILSLDWSNNRYEKGKRSFLICHISTRNVVSHQELSKRSQQSSQVPHGWTVALKIRNLENLIDGLQAF